MEAFWLWWMEEHYVWSTILTPFLVFIWCIFKEEAGRAVIAFILWMLTTAAAFKQ
jgi:hypothetical protein